MNETVISVVYPKRTIMTLSIVVIIFASLLGYFIQESVTMSDTIDKLSATNNIYEEELNTYRNLFDTTANKNAQLTDENTKLTVENDKLKHELLSLEAKLEAFEKAHADCRTPIVYCSENVLIPSNITAEELDKGLRYNLKGCGQYFVEAEKQYGVNAIFLASIAAHESGWGRSALALNKNNLFGYKQTGGGGTFREFESLEECILYVARVLKNSYLTEGGKHYNGTSVTAINIKYCSSKDWAPQVNLIAKKIIDKIVEE